MDTEFEKLMRLAEKTTIDIQRNSLERKRATGSIGRQVVSGSREEQEKRRRQELERRVRQREEDERQRQIRAKESLERKRQERIEAERAEAAMCQKRNHSQKTQQKQPQQGQKTRQQTSHNGVAVRTARNAVPDKAVPAQPRRATSTVPLSYEELMSIASGKQTRSPSLQKKIASKQRDLPQTHRSGQRLPSEPKHQHRAAVPIKASSSAPSLSRPCQQADTGISTRRPAPSPPTQPFVRAASASRKGGSKAPNSQKTATVPVQLERSPRRQPPERGVDRFGVIPKFTAKQGNPVRATPYPLPGSSDARRRNMRDGPATTPIRTDPRARASASDRRAPTSASITPHTRRSNISSHPPLRDSRQRAPVSRPMKPSEPKRPRASKYDDYDDNSEYDSMDDFIVDDEGGDSGGGYRVGSIREMFGVRYHDVNDEDDDDMEVSAMQQMREDKRSARIGRLEDDEEERRLAEEERERERRRRRRIREQQ
ncbi:hypothetical protein EV178_000373 [Coemansia sp. RSA 1646]|nr:hypothetical protein EV178_000373 [Coemansia sp. RSA 1646]